MKRYFLGKAINYKGKVAHHFFAHGSKADSEALKSYLAGRYDAEVKNVTLTANGRSALCLALKTLIPENSEVIMSGFTCYAVVQAIREANCTPVFADISLKDLNYTPETLAKLLKSHKNIKALIIQNSFGNTVDIAAFEQLAKQHGLVIVEDMAHAVGQKYPDGRIVGSVGDAAAFSFGKGKTLDTISGGALIIRKNLPEPLKAPKKAPKISSSLRARWYPVFGALMRALIPFHLSGPLTRLLLKFHWIERSADAPLDLEHRPAHFQTKLALEQLENFPKNPPKIREYAFVNNREEVLKKLTKNGYLFDEIWFETPIAPARFYKNSGFDEAACPNATKAAASIVNIPTHYPKSVLKNAQKIIEENQK